jgi:hypothetical protein
MFNVFKLPDVVFEIVAEYLNEQEIKSLATTCRASLQKPSLKAAYRREVFCKYPNITKQFLPNIAFLPDLVRHNEMKHALMKFTDDRGCLGVAIQYHNQKKGKKGVLKILEVKMNEDIPHRNGFDKTLKAMINDFDADYELYPSTPVRVETCCEKALRVGAVAIGVLASFTAMYFL